MEGNATLIQKLEEIQRLKKKAEMGLENSLFQAEKSVSYDCEICKDKEFILYVNDQGYSVSRDCSCIKVKASERRLSRTALYSKKDAYTFKTYETNEKWQKDILKKAKAFAKEPSCWFYIGGQVGAGKTHICTAIVRNISYTKDMSFEYMLFNQKSTEIKQVKFENPEKYKDELDRLINIDILFIDDLFKIEPTKADLELLFEIINSRYLNDKICVISSEKQVQAIYELDSAIGSRIIEKCKEYIISINFDESKNYRLRGFIK